MTRRELIKQEIDKVKEENLPVLLKIVQVLEKPIHESTLGGDSSWRAFLDETYGSLRDAPIEGGAQGQLGVRVLEEQTPLLSLFGALPATRPFPGKKAVREEVGRTLERSIE